MGYVCVGYVWNGYVWDMCNVLDMCGICVVDTFEMDMCGICKMCWICVGYVWCEIRQQSSEEPCDETSFGKNLHTCKAPYQPDTLLLGRGDEKCPTVSSPFLLFFGSTHFFERDEVTLSN